MKSGRAKKPLANLRINELSKKDFLRNENVPVCVREAFYLEAPLTGEKIRKVISRDEKFRERALNAQPSVAIK